MTTYYVSGTGSDSNNGTATGTPLKTLQAAANKTKPGDTVNVMNGTYTGSPNGLVLDVKISGTAAAPITYQAADGHKPIIDGTGTWNAVYIEANYINFRGFEVKGSADKYSYDEVMAHYSTSEGKYNGNGIVTASAHHITIENNLVHHICGGGIETGKSDYLKVLRNTVHSCAWWSVYGNSGIGIVTSVNVDNGPVPHVTIDGNTSYLNANKVPEYRFHKMTDGNGISLDSNNDTGFTGGFLIQNNTVHDSGGVGIVAFKSNNATITKNATWANNQTPTQAPENGEIYNNQSSNVTISNNTGKPDVIPPDPTPVPPDPTPSTDKYLRIEVDGVALASGKKVTFIVP